MRKIEGKEPGIDLGSSEQEKYTNLFEKIEKANIIPDRKKLLDLKSLENCLNETFQKYGKINTFVPPHPEYQRNVWSCVPEHGRIVGTDKNASWLMGSHLPLRDSIVVECVKRGWQIVRK